MTRLIGTRCKHSNVLSRGVLIARILLGNLKINYYFCPRTRAKLGAGCPKPSSALVLDSAEWNQYLEKWNVLSWLFGAGIAQLAERHVHNVEVTGSSPGTRMKSNTNLFFVGQTVLRWGAPFASNSKHFTQNLD